VITVEENAVQGGFGSAVLEMFADAGWFPRSMVRLGIPDRFVPHGAQAVLRRELEIDAEAVRSAALRLCRGGHGRVVRAFG
jgi:1-deoxy-D-xylulose-5-phosphate synthase